MAEKSIENIHYSIKDNGIMVNIDLTDPIQDDDIIGWKSDRGWVYLTVLGVRPPSTKLPFSNLQHPLKKVKMDDFQNSTQLAFLIGRPIVGFDIINSQTSPNTIVFIHTEMNKSKVANLKTHIKNEGSSVFRLAESNKKDSNKSEINKRVEKARKSFEDAKQVALLTKRSTKKTTEYNNDGVNQNTTIEHSNPKGVNKSELALRVEKARNNYQNIKEIGLLNNTQTNVLNEKNHKPAKQSLATHNDVIKSKKSKKKEFNALIEKARATLANEREKSSLQNSDALESIEPNESTGADDNHELWTRSGESEAIEAYNGTDNSQSQFAEKIDSKIIDVEMYGSGGIQVNTNMDGIPIFVNGEYVGETPLLNIISVEPGWHQISSFKAANKKALSLGNWSFVNNDLIVHNQSFGVETIYVESGKIVDVAFRYNQVNNKTPHIKPRELKGGWFIGIPMITAFLFLISNI